MSNGKIEQHLPAVREAVSAFLNTILGDEHPTSVSAGTLALLDVLPEEGFHLLAEGDSVRHALVHLDREWLDLLSTAMLGDALKPDDEGADDLLREIAGQVYGAIRSRIAASDGRLPDLTFALTTPKDARAALPGELDQVEFDLVRSESRLTGRVYLNRSAVPASASSDAVASSGAASPTKSTVGVAPAAFPELGVSMTHGGDGGNFGLLAEVELEVTVELGRRRIPLADVLRLTTGSVIELEKLVGEPLEVYANGRLIAEGEAVVIDEQFGVRITNLVSSSKRAKAFI